MDKQTTPTATPTTMPTSLTEQDTGLLIQLGAQESGFRVVSESNEGSPDSIMEVEGIALQDGIISANQRYYSQEFNDRLISNTNKYVGEGGIATMFSSHGKAAGTGGFFSPLVEELPVGKISELFRAKGSAEIVRYRATIMPTAEGRDIQVLLRHGGIGSTSIRADGRTVSSRKGNINGQDVEVMEDATLSGIDFTAHPGVAGAGIVQIFESAPHISYTAVNETEEDDMLEDATLDQLREKYPELVEELEGELKEAHAAEVGKLTEKLVSMTQALEASANPEESVQLSQDLEESQARTAELELSVAIAEAAHVGMSKAVAEKIRAGNPKTADEVQELAHDAIKEALDEALAGTLGNSSESVVGEAHPPDRAQSKTVRKQKMSAEQSDMVRLAGGTVF